MSAWYWKNAQGATIEAATLGDLIAAVERGEIEPTSQVSSDGENWKPASKVLALSIAFDIADLEPSEKERKRAAFLGDVARLLFFIALGAFVTFHILTEESSSRVLRQIYYVFIVCAIAWFLRKVGGAKEEGNDEEPTVADAAQTPGETSSEEPTVADAAQTSGDMSKKTEDDGRRYGAWGCVVAPFILLALYPVAWMEANVWRPAEIPEFDWQEMERQAQEQLKRARERAEEKGGNDFLGDSASESRRDSEGWRGTGIWEDLIPLEPAKTDDASEESSRSENSDDPEIKETTEPTSNGSDSEQTGVKP